MATTEQHVNPATLTEWWVQSWKPVTHEDSYDITDIDGEVPREIPP